MERFVKDDNKIELLAPVVAPTERVYEKTLKKMGIYNDDFIGAIKRYDEDMELALSRFNAPLLRYAMVPDSLTMLLQQLSDLKRGPLRSPLILGYAAKGRNDMTYAAVVTFPRGNGDGSEKMVSSFIRKPKNGDLEEFSTEEKTWHAMSGATMIYKMQLLGPAGHDLIAGLCEFFDKDILHISPYEVSDKFNEYADLCTLNDRLQGLGKIQLLVLECNKRNIPEEEAEGRYFPIMVPGNDGMKGCAVAMKDGMFYLLQYREAFRFSSHMTIIWGDSLIGNPEFSNTAYATKNMDDIFPILQAMWSRQSKEGYYRIFPASDQTFAEIHGNTCTVSSFKGKDEITKEEEDSIKRGAELLRKEKPVQHAPKY